MASNLDVSPTRGAMLRLKAQLEESRSQHDLLDRKRRVLIQELMQRIDEASELEEEGRKALQAAHAAMQRARMRMGSDRVDSISLSATARVGVDIRVRSLLGLRLPRVEVQVESVPLPYGLSDTSAALDEARERWLDVLRWLSRAAEITAGLWRTAAELKKTQRQVNALESILLPRLAETIADIESRLEEEEREEIVYASKVKRLRRPS